jgi:hypothetical protein
MQLALGVQTKDFELQQSRNLIVLKKPSILGDRNFYEHLNKLQSYSDGYWKWRRDRRIRKVFVVGDISNPANGRIHRFAIKRKKGSFIELANSERFDVHTGRCLIGEPRYIFPVEDRQVWAAWEPQFLRRRVEHGLPALRFRDLRIYADLLHPEWHLRVFNEGFNRPADSLCERETARMALYRRLAGRAILGHLPAAILELRALVEMMESDAR